MDEITKWVLTVCCAVLICGVVSMLIPSSSMSRMMNMVLGLFLLCCFLIPTGISLSDFQLSLDAPEELRRQAAEESTDFFTSSLLQSSEEALRPIILSEAAKHGINEDEILIYMEPEDAIEGAGSARLTATVRLPGRARENHDAMLRSLEYELGIPVRLEYLEEEP